MLGALRGGGGERMDMSTVVLALLDLIIIEEVTKIATKTEEITGDLERIHQDRRQGDGGQDLGLDQVHTPEVVDLVQGHLPPDDVDLAQGPLHLPDVVGPQNTVGHDLLHAIEGVGDLMIVTVVTAQGRGECIAHVVCLKIQ